MYSDTKVPGGSGQNFFYGCGWVALSVYIFSWLFILDLSRAGEVIFLLCFIVIWFKESDKEVRFHWVFFVLLSFIGLQIFVYLFAVERFPEFSGGQSKAARHVAKLFLCIAVAWWLRGSVKASIYLASLFVAGFLFTLFIEFDSSEWVRGVLGDRVNFGFTNAQHASLYFAMSLVFSVCWFLRTCNKGFNILPLFLAVLLVVISAIGVFVTQTRGVWLACFLTFLFVGGAAFFSNSKKAFEFLFSLRGVWLICSGAVTIAILSWQFLPSIEKRIEPEKAVIQDVLKGDLQDIPYTSIGNRVNTWHYAFSKIGERPLTGWGAESRKPLIDEGPFPEFIKDKFGHFHNGYIEIFLAYGMVGFILLSILTLASLKGVFRLRKSGEMALFYGLLSAWSIFFVVNLFESYIIFRTGMYIYVVLAGIGLSFYLFGVKRYE